MQRYGCGLVALSLAALALSCGEPHITQPGGPGAPGATTDPFDSYEDVNDAIDAQYLTAFPDQPDGLTQFDRSPQSPVLAPWIEVLDPSTTASISRVEDDRVVFSATAAAALSSIEPMQIISSTDANNYFLRRILRIEEQGGALIVHTLDASIAEAMVQGRLGLGALPTGPTPPPGGLRQQALSVSGTASNKTFSAEITGRSFSGSADLPISDTVKIKYIDASGREVFPERSFNVDVPGEPRTPSAVQSITISESSP